MYFAKTTDSTEKLFRIVSGWARKNRVLYWAQIPQRKRSSWFLCSLVSIVFFSAFVMGQRVRVLYGESCRERFRTVNQWVGPTCSVLQCTDVVGYEIEVDSYEKFAKM